MSKAKSNSLGLGLVSEDAELPLDQLPPWSEEKVKTLPMLWKNDVTGSLHLQVHPSAVQELLIEPIPAGVERSADALFPDGGHVKDLKEVREIVYGLQRPGFAPPKIYAHDWEEGDMCLFHNQGVIHSVVGAFAPEEVR